MTAVGVARAAIQAALLVALVAAVGLALLGRRPCQRCGYVRGHHPDCARHPIARADRPGRSNHGGTR